MQKWQLSSVFKKKWNQVSHLLSRCLFLSGFTSFIGLHYANVLTLEHMSKSSAGSIRAECSALLGVLDSVDLGQGLTSALLTSPQEMPVVLV